jgi:predicted transcriptional regulator
MDDGHAVERPHEAVPDGQASDGQASERSVPNAGVPEAAAPPFLEDFAGLMEQAGMPRMPARVFVALLASDVGRLTAAELSSLLTASPAAISGAVRYLTQVHMVSREREPGSRKDVYVVRDDVWHEATLRKDQLLHLWVKQLDVAIDQVGPRTPAGRRLAVSRAFFAFVLREMPLMIRRWDAERAELIAGWS